MTVTRIKIYEVEDFSLKVRTRLNNFLIFNLKTEAGGGGIIPRKSHGTHGAAIQPKLKTLTTFYIRNNFLIL